MSDDIYTPDHGVDFDAPRDFYDDWYENRETRWPVVTLPGGGQVSTFPGEQPSTIPGQLTLDDEALALDIKRVRLARAASIGRTIRPNYTGD